jgi:hypothetical protein
MPKHHRRLTAVALLVLALGGGLLGGCGQKAGTAPVASAPDTSIADLTQMTPAQKTSQIAPNFPLEVPVAAGDVVRGEAQSAGAWVYQVVVPGRVAPVRNWYVRMYSNAEWTVGAQSGNEVTLRKGGAETRLQFEPADSGNEARTQVTGSIGVGARVLETQ